MNKSVLNKITSSHSISSAKEFIATLFHISHFVADCFPKSTFCRKVVLVGKEILDVQMWKVFLSWGILSLAASGKSIYLLGK